MKILPFAMLISLALAAAASAAEPPALAAARAAYEKAVARATAPLRDKYLAELERLQKSLTTQGKLEDAMAVRTARLTERFAGWYEGFIPANEWRWKCLFRVDGTCLSIAPGHADVTGTWRLEGGVVRVAWSIGTWYEISLSNLDDADKGGLGGTSGKGSRTTDEIVLTKKR